MAKLQKSPGRPRSKNKRQTRTVTVTNDAWSGLRRQADAQGISISELNEKLGIKELAVVTAQQEKLSDASVYQRLKAYMEEPDAGFESLLAFIETSLIKLGCKSASSAEFLDQVTGVVLGMMTILYLTSYLYPDISIKSFSACMPLLTYKLLLNLGFPVEGLDQSRTSDRSKGVSSESVDVYISQIHDTLARLKESQVDFYPVLRMKFIEGLSTNQIERILKLQNKSISRVEIQARVKRALGRFRELCRRDVLENPETERLTSYTTQTKSLIEFPRDDVHKYCYLMSKKYWYKSERQQLSDLIEKASDKKNSRLALWFSELNILIGVRQYQSQQRQLRQNVANIFDEHISEQRELIDNELMYCTSRDQVDSLLQGIIKNQINHVRNQYFSKFALTECAELSFGIEELIRCQYSI